MQQLDAPLVFKGEAQIADTDGAKLEQMNLIDSRNHRRDMTDTRTADTEVHISAPETCLRLMIMQWPTVIQERRRHFAFCQQVKRWQKKEALNKAALKTPVVISEH